MKQINGLTYISKPKLTNSTDFFKKKVFSTVIHNTYLKRCYLFGIRKPPTGIISTQKIPIWNIPTHVFKYSRPRLFNFLFFQYCHCHHWYCLKDCLVILCFMF